MDIFKLFYVIPQISQKINETMKDRMLTIKEAIEIIDETLKGFTGRSLDDIGFKIIKTRDGKTKIEFEI